jgi:hypothetical protein
MYCFIGNLPLSPRRRSPRSPPTRTGEREIDTSSKFLASTEQDVVALHRLGG